jgi:hypothetical protein
VLYATNLEKEDIYPSYSFCTYTFLTLQYIHMKKTLLLVGLTFGSHLRGMAS